jgi:uncharacterized protein YecT (DUF1311 family)
LKKYYLILVIYSLSFCVVAYSQDEQNAYELSKNEYLLADKELNKLYNSQISEFKKDGGEFYGKNISRDVFLKKAQLVWIKMRDASCDYETYESMGGSGFSTIYENCLLEKTKERIKYLKENN